MFHLLTSLPHSIDRNSTSNMITISDHIYIYILNKVSFNIHKQSHLQGEQYREMELAVQLDILNNIIYLIENNNYLAYFIIILAYL